MIFTFSLLYPYGIVGNDDTKERKDNLLRATKYNDSSKALHRPRINDDDV